MTALLGHVASLVFDCPLRIWFAIVLRLQMVFLR